MKKKAVKKVQKNKPTKRVTVKTYLLYGSKLAIKGGKIRVTSTQIKEEMTKLSQGANVADLPLWAYLCDYMPKNWQTIVERDGLLFYGADENCLLIKEKTPPSFEQLIKQLVKKQFID